MNNAMNTQQKARPEAQTVRAPTLPVDTSQALNMLVRLTQNLSNLADRESNALAQNDMLTFAILQDEKTLVTEQYMNASEEFRSNLNIYHGADQNLLTRLENLQKDLGEKTRVNNDTVQNIYDRAQNRTQNSLLTVQELGQDQRVKLNTAAQATDSHEDVMPAHRRGA